MSQENVLTPSEYDESPEGILFGRPDPQVTRDLLCYEIAYPIYRFTLHLSGYSEKTTGFTIMEPDLLSYDELISEAEYCKDKFLWEPNRWALDEKKKVCRGDQGVQVLWYEVQFVRFDTWLGTWFQHLTRNIHLSDDDLEESFRRFVRRMMPLHLNNQRPKEYQDPNIGVYCLMGAEDRWRWKAPCRCAECQALGVTRIDH